MDDSIVYFGTLPPPDVSLLEESNIYFSSAEVVHVVTHLAGCIGYRLAVFHTAMWVSSLYRNYE